MFGNTPRQRMAVAATAILGLVAAAAALMQVWQIAVAILALMFAGMTILMLDLRRRSAELSKRLRATSSAIDKLAARGHGMDGDATMARLAATSDSIRKLVKKQPQEFEALLQLYSQIEPRDAMPASGMWSLNPRGLLNLYMVVQRHRPQTVVELGSGTSTVWLGYALADLPSAHLVSFDHDEWFAERTQETVDLHTDAVARTEVRHAPLTSIEIGDEKFRWYRPEALADVRQIDLLVVDGPPAKSCRQARYPALPMLRDRLADGAVIVLDDATRGDEKEIIKRWMAEVPGLKRRPSAVGRQAVLQYLPEPRERAATPESEEVATHG